MDREHGVIDFGQMHLTDSAQITEITVNNAGTNAIKLKRFVALESVSDFMLSDKHSVTVAGKVNKVIKLPAGKSYKISALFKPSRLGEFKQLIVFEFEEEGDTPQTYHIARFLTGQGTNEDVKSILPVHKYRHPKAVARVVDPKVQIIGGIPPPRYVGEKKNYQNSPFYSCTLSCQAFEQG